MELRRYAIMLWRWLWLILLGTALAAGSVYVISQRQTPVYQASTMLLISQSKAGQVLDLASVSSNSDRLSSTYAALMHDGPVLDEVIRRLGLTVDMKRLASAVKVTPVRNTQLIQLTVDDTDPARAAAVANEIPKVFIAQNESLQASRFSTSKASLQEQIQDAQDEIVRLQNSIAALNNNARSVDAGEMDRLQRNLLAQQTSYATLYKTYEDMRLEEAKQLDTLLVTRPAEVPTVPIRPLTMQNTLLAAIVGMLLGLTVAYVAEYLDDVIKDPDEVQKVLGLTTLSAVPASDQKETTSELHVLVNSQSYMTEAYRVLRTNLQFAAVGRPLHTLMVTSASPGEGKTTTAANLAVAQAQAGKRIVIMDADLHRPRLHRVFKLPNAIGVTTALLDESIDLSDLLQEGPIEGLRVLTSGPLPPNPAELLGTQQMKHLLERLSTLCDMVILDSPPTMALSDAAVLATHVDGTLLVLDATGTRRELARRAVGGLRRVQAHVVGVVLNRIPTRGAGSYFFYYTHYDQYYGSSEDQEQDGSGEHSSGDRRERRPALRGFWARLTHPLQTLLTFIQR